jgi:diacylglycerol O-acyltransferase
MTSARLTGLDTAFLCLDEPGAPMNMGGVAVFSAHQRVHPARIVQLLAGRASRIPTLRQRIRPNWLPPGSVSWVPDENFDVEAHVIAHRLQAPRYVGQLAAKVAEIMAEPLDMSGPPWQLHVITGLAGGRFAVLAKLHHALADGAAATLLALGLLDGFTEHAAGARRPAGDTGFLDRLRRTGELIDIASSVARSARPRTPGSPLLAHPSRQRRLATMRIELEEIKSVRRKHGGTTNDVLLAALSGALRQWLVERGHRVNGRPIRALVPVNSSRGNPDRRSSGNQLSGYLCDLPVGEPDPLLRLRAVRTDMDAHKKTGTRRGPGAIPVLADGVPAALHRLAGPMLARGAPLLFDTVVTNVPLPNLTLTLDGAELREVYPVVPLAHGHGLGVAFCTYRGHVHIGLHADAAALPDVDRIGDLVPHALDAMRELSAAPRTEPVTVLRPGA